MFDFFWKKRRAAKQQGKADQVLRAQEAEQQRKFEALMNAQTEVLRLYEPAKPTSLADELKAVAVSFERGKRDDPA